MKKLLLAALLAALTPAALAADNPEPELPEVDEAHFYRVAFTVGDHLDQNQQRPGL